MQLLAFAEQTTEFVGVTDPWGRIVYLNPAARKRLGVTTDVAELTTGDVFPPEAFTLYYDVIRPQLLRTGEWTGTIPVKVAGAEAVPMLVSTTARLGPGGEINESVMVGRELSGVEPAGTTDSSDVDEITGLLRRPAFDVRARLVLAAAARDRESCALVLVTVFDANSTYEPFHPRTAATVMRAMAGRMRRLSRTTDVVGVIGEGQLGLLLRGVATHGEALRTAQTVYEALIETPVTTPGEEIVPSMGCGVGFAEPGGDLADLLERAAAIRWYEPRGSEPASGALAAYADPHDPRDARAAATLEEFRLGLSRGEVQPHACPIVRLESGAVVGYQGLARWHHRRFGVLEAVTFADMIAETSLANQVDLRVARETAAVVTLITRAVPLNLYAPVSRRLISDVRTEQYLCEIADAFSLDMHQLHLQVARPLVNDWSPALRDALQSLRAAGIRFVVTGLERVAGVDRLVALGFDELHLSHELTVAVMSDEDARRTVATVARVAHEHDALVAAVGVNDERHRDLLLAAGCDLASGDLFGEAVPTNTID